MSSSADRFGAIQVRLNDAPKKLGARLSLIVDWGSESIDDTIDAIGIEAVLAGADQLYDLYVAPLNIPLIPDMLEPALIDVPLKSAMRLIIRGFHDRIHTEG